MDWLQQNWQTVATLLVVALTAVIFAVRLLRPQRKSGCSGGCGCEAAKKPGSADVPPASVEER